MGGVASDRIMTGATGNSCTKKKNSVARRRWKLLAEAVQKSSMKNTACNAAISMCKFQGFGLICMTSIRENWYAVTCLNSSLKIYTRLIRRDFSPSQLMGFNNTGNICIWPSEELLTYYCLINLHLFKGRSVLELGGGMTCLAGLFLAVSGVPSHVLLTDGNKACIENVQVMLKENPSSSPVQAGVLRWECDAEVKAQEGKFDVVMCGDCVFFDDSRDSLLRTLVSVLRPGGMGLVVAPARTDTFKLFAKLCEAYFKVTTYESYDETVAKCVEKVSLEGVPSVTTCFVCVTTSCLQTG